MQRSARPLLLHPGFRLLAEARAADERRHFELQCELADLRAEIAELREVMQLLVGMAREQAEGNVAELRKQLEGALLRLAHHEHRSGRPLH
jgi:hypothetical protein